MHGGIFAKAAFWEESLWSDVDNPSAKYAAKVGAHKIAKKNAKTESSSDGKGKQVLKSKKYHNISIMNCTCDTMAQNVQQQTSIQ